MGLPHGSFGFMLKQTLLIFLSFHFSVRSSLWRQRAILGRAQMFAVNRSVSGNTSPIAAPDSHGLAPWIIRLHAKADVVNLSVISFFCQIKLWRERSDSRPRTNVRSASFGMRLHFTHRRP